MGNSTGTSTDTNTGTGLGPKPSNDPFKDIKQPPEPPKGRNDDPGKQPTVKPEPHNGNH